MVLCSSHVLTPAYILNFFWQVRMEGHSRNEISSAEAILVGALSSGVNVRNTALC
jgi:hypothetical protein